MGRRREGENRSGQEGKGRGAVVHRYVAAPGGAERSGNWIADRWISLARAVIKRTASLLQGQGTGASETRASVNRPCG